MAALEVTRLLRARFSLPVDCSVKWLSLNHSRRPFSSTLRNGNRKTSSYKWESKQGKSKNNLPVSTNLAVFSGDPVFTLDDIPPVATFSSQAAQQLSDSRWTPQELHAAAKHYVTAAIRHEKGWRAEVGSKLSPEMLHHTALHMFKPLDSKAYSIALHMFFTGVTLSYAPSVLTLVRDRLLDAGKAIPKENQEIRNEFQRLVDCGDPNAQTLYGTILYKGSRETEALRWLRSAAEIGGDKPGAWDWQILNSLTRATICLRLGELQEGHDVLQHAALTLDNHVAMFRWAALFFFHDLVPSDQRIPLVRVDKQTGAQTKLVLPKPPPDVDPINLLISAAVNGHTPSAKLLSMVERRKCDDEGLSENERHARLVLAGEWQTLGRSSLDP